jgi:uncharacterized protein YlxW (UPF0749 family)
MSSSSSSSSSSPNPIAYSRNTQQQQKVTISADKYNELQQQIIELQQKVNKYQPPSGYKLQACLKQLEKVLCSDSFRSQINAIQPLRNLRYRATMILELH